MPPPVSVVLRGAVLAVLALLLALALPAAAQTGDANGVPFFAPLNPIAPLDAQDTVSPVVVLIVTIVLLNVD